MVKLPLLSGGHRASRFLRQVTGHRLEKKRAVGTAKRRRPIGQRIPKGEPGTLQIIPIEFAAGVHSGASELRPQAFVFENVVSITHPTNRAFFATFLAECENLGFSIQLSKVNAASFGVPQSRQRIIVAGLRGRHAPATLHPTHGDKDLSGTLQPIVTASEAIEHLDRKELAEIEEIVSGRYA